MIYTYGINSYRTTSKVVLKKYISDNILDEGVILDVCPGLRKAIENHFKVPIHRHSCKEFGFLYSENLVYVPSCVISIGRQDTTQRIVLIRDILYVYDKEEESLTEFI